VARASTEEVIEYVQDKVAEESLQKYVEMDISSSSLHSYTLSLDRIQSTVRGQGYAEKALKILTYFADMYKCTVTLLLHCLDEHTDAKRLKHWYEKHGFVEVRSELGNGTQMVRPWRSI